MSHLLLWLPVFTYFWVQWNPCPFSKGEEESSDNAQENNGRNKALKSSKTWGSGNKKLNFYYVYFSLQSVKIVKEKVI